MVKGADLGSGDKGSSPVTRTHGVLPAADSRGGRGRLVAPPPDPIPPIEDSPPLSLYDKWLAEDEGSEITENCDSYDQRTDDENAYWGSVT